MNDKLISGMCEASKIMGSELYTTDRFIRMAIEWLSSRGKLQIESLNDPESSIENPGFSVGTPGCFCADDSLYGALTGAVFGQVEKERLEAEGGW